MNKNDRGSHFAEVNSGSGANEAGSGISNQCCDNSNPKGIPSAVQSKGSIGCIAYSSVDESSDDEGLSTFWINHKGGSGKMMKELTMFKLISLGRMDS